MTNTPTRILFCPIGDAKHRPALRETVEFAERLGDDARVSLLAVIPEASAWDRVAHPRHIDAVVEEQTASWNSMLQRWTNEFEAIDSFEIIVGSTANSITHHSLSEDADLIVLSAGDDASDKAAVRRIMRTSEAPVWLLRPTRAKTRRVLATLNPEPDELDLNLTIIEQADHMANTLDGELSLMAAWVLYGDQTMRRSAFIKTPIAHYHDLFDLREQITTRGLDELALAANPPCKYDMIVENGEPAPTILEMIRKRRINLLVIGTVGRAGLSGLLLGNTAEHLADSAQCSVLAVKPPGFTSPLRR